MPHEEARFWGIRRASVLGSQARTSLCQAMLTHEYTYAYAEAKSGELDSLILPHINTDYMQRFLDEVGASSQRQDSHGA